MRKIAFVLSVMVALGVFLGISAYSADKDKEEVMPSSANKKILVVYFSHSGNTREIADQVHKLAGGDIFEIQTVKPYSSDYGAVVKQAKEELASGYKPALKTKVENIGAYDVIFIGYPNWCSTIPMSVVTFLSENDLSGKTVVPFCTHGGGGLGHSLADIAKLCPKSKLLEALAIPGKDVGSAQDKVAQWLRKIKIMP
jgi:flavodoxin